MKVQFNSTPSQYESLARNKQQRKRRITKPLEPDELSKFQKELDACLSKWK